MPRRSVVIEDDDDAVPLSDLVRTGEASRLRRRGAMRATAPRRDDEEDVSLLPFPRIKGAESCLELECGVRSRECSFTPAGPSRPSPLPRSSSPRKQSDVGIVFSSTGCGAIVTTSALPGSIATKHVYTSTESVSSNIAHLHHKYLEPEQRTLAETLTKDVPMCQCDWEAIGCRVCGNALGLLYAACHPRHGNTTPTYIFFPSAVTPSPEFTFPPAQHPESDDMSIDSPTLSPRVTRYFRSDDEFWPGEMNPPLWGPDRGFTPTPPRSPPTAATPLAYTTWQGGLPPPVSAPQTQTPASRTTTDAPRHRELTHTVPVREPFNDWRSFFRSVSPRRTERPPPPNTNDATQPEETPPQLPPDTGTTLPHEHRDRTALERSSLPRTDTREMSSRSLEPPSLHRVARRPIPPSTRRSTSLLDWSNRGRHIPASDANSSWAVQGSDERFSRRASASRRITMPIPAPAPPPPLAPAPTFSLLDAVGERSYPPSARSSLDMRDTLGVSMEVEADEAAIAHWLMQEHESESPAERSWNHDPDGESEDVGDDDNEEKEDELDERRAERTPRNDISRAESHSNSLWGLISR